MVYLCPRMVRDDVSFYGKGCEDRCFMLLGKDFFFKCDSDSEGSASRSLYYRHKSGCDCTFALVMVRRIERGHLLTVNV